MLEISRPGYLQVENDHTWVYVDAVQPVTVADVRHVHLVTLHTLFEDITIVHTVARNSTGSPVGRFCTTVTPNCALRTLRFPTHPVCASSSPSPPRGIDTCQVPRKSALRKAG